MADIILEALTVCRTLIPSLNISLMGRDQSTICRVLQRARAMALLLEEIVFAFEFAEEQRSNAVFLASYIGDQVKFLDELAEREQSRTKVNNCAKVYTGEQGRPSFQVDQQQIEGLRSIGMNWTDIALLLGISVRTLHNKRQFFVDFQDTAFTNMSDDELDEEIHQVMMLSPNCGEIMMQGALRAKNLKVQRWRVRDSMTRLDPIGKLARRLFTVKRRVYSVEAPNALWHIDSHHKLIRWRIVTHGCIDGFSRMVIYLYSCTNNGAATVLHLFENAVNNFYWPRRVRSDQGMENLGVARLMLNKFGTERKPVLTGRSVHNQRIERLWKDVHEYVTSNFRELFLWMEDSELLDPLNEIHLFALEFIFVPRINRALDLFLAQWNSHSLRTARSKSPIQLWTEGVYKHPLDGTLLESEIYIDPETYGVDVEAGGMEIRTRNNINVPQIDVQLDERQTETLGEIDPLEEDGYYGIRIYERVVQVLQ
eukprot:Seg2881.9 transcript_id=Seg2881.9/GoldUCD/mRNA.D3Y31 product="hypothetical protein" protein_id=Seg2881.9/GoldUCD/D3Y31